MDSFLFLLQAVNVPIYSGFANIFSGFSSLSEKCHLTHENLNFDEVQVIYFLLLLLRYIQETVVA